MRTGEVEELLRERERDRFQSSEAGAVAAPSWQSTRARPTGQGI